MTNQRIDNDFEIVHDPTNSSDAPEESENIVLEEIHHIQSNHEIHVDRNGKQKKYNKKHLKFISRLKKNKIFKVLNKIGFIIILLILILLVTGLVYFFISREIGKRSLIKNNSNAVISVNKNAQSEDNGQTVTYKGETYKYNLDLASIVILGIDESELANIDGNAGTADAVYILTFDTKTSKCSLITVNRDTMVDVHVRSRSGKEMGYEKMQLAAAYAYGDGRESSCENTLESLSRIFYNIPFTNYVALSWDSIGPLNDAIGGVTLKCLEDVHTTYSTFTKGETLTLHGQDAWSYVKYRDTSILESNPLRLSRQRQYIKTYVDKMLPMVRDDLSFAGKLYDVAKPYMCTTLSREEVIYIASEMVPTLYSTKDINFVDIKGEITQPGKYAEFTPDEDNLYETILKVFYVKQD